MDQNRFFKSHFFLLHLGEQVGKFNLSPRTARGVQRPFNNYIYTLAFCSNFPFFGVKHKRYKRSIVQYQLIRSPLGFMMNNIILGWEMPCQRIFINKEYKAKSPRLHSADIYPRKQEQDLRVQRTYRQHGKLSFECRQVLCKVYTVGWVDFWF